MSIEVSVQKSHTAESHSETPLQDHIAGSVAVFS